MSDAPDLCAFGCYWHTTRDHDRITIGTHDQPIPYTPQGLIPRGWDVRVSPLRDVTSVYIVPGDRPPRDDGD